MSSARSITASVNPPRAVFLDYPLGHTAGRAHDLEGQLAIMRDTLQVLRGAAEPGQIVDLEHPWPDGNDWKTAVLNPDDGHADSRQDRFPTPQYQFESDEELAAQNPECETCIFVTEPV